MVWFKALRDEILTNRHVFLITDDTSYRGHFDQKDVFQQKDKDSAMGILVQLIQA